jgi:hypothetical protein
MVWIAVQAAVAAAPTIMAALTSSTAAASPPRTPPRTRTSVEFCCIQLPTAAIAVCRAV